MLKNLNTGAIGVKATLAEQIAYAQAHGFQSIDFSIGEAQQVVAEQGVNAVRDLFASAEILPGSWGFPVEFRPGGVWGSPKSQPHPRHSQPRQDSECAQQKQDCRDHE